MPLNMNNSIYTFLFLVIQLGNALKVDVWGPGLSPEKIILPARYFFIKVSEGNNSFKFNSLHISITGSSKSGNCRLWQQVLDRKNKSFIVRYRLYEKCNNFQIELKYDGQHLEKSPYFFKGPIYNEDCLCPVQNLEEWLENNECPKMIQQISNDMKMFHNVNMTKVLKHMQKHYNYAGSMSYCHYSIISNELYRKCYGQHVGFHIFSDAIFLSILRKVKLPDQSFFINLGDWPLIKKSSKVTPMFSWCGSDDTLDIVLPTYDLTQSTLENMGRVMLDMLSIQGNIGKKWEEKIPQAFWRGRDSNEERLKLFNISREYPELYNVSMTNFFFYREKEHLYGPKTPHISFFKFFDFKYQLNIDGSVAAYRFPYLLVGDSVVFKQNSPYYEHFYKELVPGVHYIPFKKDLSDLTDKIKWAIENDNEARVISENGRKFAQDNLMPQDIICYYVVALKEWSQRISQPSIIFDGMEKVTDKDTPEQQCQCENDKHHFQDEL